MCVLVFAYAGVYVCKHTHATACVCVCVSDFWAGYPDIQGSTFK